MTDKKPKFPSVGKQLKTLAADLTAVAGDVLQGNSILVSDRVQHERWSICSACEFLTQARCTKCGCYMEAKTQLVASECPIGKWKRVSSEPAPPCAECGA